MWTLRTSTVAPLCFSLSATAEARLCHHEGRHASCFGVILCYLCYCWRQTDWLAHEGSTEEIKFISRFSFFRENSSKVSYARRPHQSRPLRFPSAPRLSACQRTYTFRKKNTSQGLRAIVHTHHPFVHLCISCAQRRGDACIPPRVRISCRRAHRAYSKFHACSAHHSPRSSVMCISLLITSRLFFLPCVCVCVAYVGERMHRASSHVR